MYYTFAMELSTLTADQIRDLDREKTPVLFPVGSSEQHGPHLPVGTKTFLAEAFAYEALNRLKKEGINSLVIPTFSYASCQASYGFNSSFSINGRIFSDLIYEIGHSFYREGFKFFFIINHSISPDCLKAIGEAMDDLRKLNGFTVFDPIPCWMFSLKPILDGYLQNLGVQPEKEIHADVKETSAMMYLDSELVQAKMLPELPEMRVNLSWENLKGNFTYLEMGGKYGYIGSPSKSDPEIGKIYMEEGSLALTQMIVSAMKNEPVPKLPVAIRMLLKIIDLDEVG